MMTLLLLLLHNFLLFSFPFRWLFPSFAFYRHKISPFCNSDNTLGLSMVVQRNVILDSSTNTTQRLVRLFFSFCKEKIFSYTRAFANEKNFTCIQTHFEEQKNEEWTKTKLSGTQWNKNRTKDKLNEWINERTGWMWKTKAKYRAKQTMTNEMQKRRGEATNKMHSQTKPKNEEKAKKKK